MSDNQPPNYDPNNSGGYGQAPQFGAGGAYGGSQPHPQGTMILVLGILSLVCCGIFTGIPAIVMGGRARKEIEASPGSYDNGGLVTAGWVCGIIGTIFSVLGGIYAIFVFAAAGSMS